MLRTIPQVAYNKLVDYVDLLKKELLMDTHNKSRCKKLIKKINIFKYLSFGLLSKSIDKELKEVGKYPDKNRYYNIMNLLINNGIKSDNADLLYAVRSSNSLLLKLLLQKGCNPNPVPPDNIDVFKLALRRSLEIVVDLLNHGAKIQDTSVNELNEFIGERLEGEIITFSKQNFDDLTVLYEKIRESALSSKEAQIGKLQDVISKLINRYCLRSDICLKDFNSKEKVDQELLHDMLKSELVTLEQKDKAQKLLDDLKVRWAGEINQVLAKGQVPIYEKDEVNGEILGHKASDAMPKVFGDRDTASNITAFLNGKDLVGVTQMDAPKEPKSPAGPYSEKYKRKPKGSQGSSRIQDISRPMSDSSIGLSHQVDPEDPIDDLNQGDNGRGRG